MRLLIDKAATVQREEEAAKAISMKNGSIFSEAVMTKEQFSVFLLKSSDEEFIVDKAIIALRLSGALRKCEIYNIKFGE